YSYRVTDGSIGGPTASATSVTDLVAVSPALVADAMAPPSPSIDNGQSIAFTAKPSGGSGPYSYQWYSDGTCTVPIPSATSSTYTASPSSTTSYAYKVSDSAYSPSSVCSQGNTVTVNSALIAGPISPLNPTIDNGQTITLTSHASGGTPSLSYQWYLDGTCGTSILGANLSTYTTSPTVTGIYSYKVADSALSPSSQCSVQDTVTVASVLAAGAVTPVSPKIDNGQSITLTANPSGGVTPYAYQWYSDGTCTSAISIAVSSTYNASPTATTTYSYKVTDSAYSPFSVCSPSNSVTVNSALVAGAVTPSSPTIDSGQLITLIAHASGGTPPLSYQWYSDGTCTVAIPGATSSTYSVTLSATTTFSYRTTDLSQGSPLGSPCSPGDTVTVNALLISGPITPSGQTINNGQPITLTSAPSGGTRPYSYQWYSSSACPSGSIITGAAASALVDSPSSTTTYSYKVTDSSYSPASQCSSGDTVKVNPILAARAITPTNPTIDAGQQIVLTSQASGGTQPFSYQWYSDASCTTAIIGETQQTYLASPIATTIYSYKVTDSANLPVSECSPGDTVTVSTQLVSGSPTPTSPAVDIGQSLTLTANPSGGTAPYHYRWYSSTSSACPAGASFGTSGTLLVTPTTNTYYCYTVTDSSTGNPPATAT